VGDVIKIKHNEQVPADCVVLKVQNEKGQPQQGYIQTAQLDGERNLKPKLHIQEVSEMADLSHIRLECGQPDPNLYFFEGILRIE
jgi:phospholipid-translocating ATPase